MASACLPLSVAMQSMPIDFKASVMKARKCGFGSTTNALVFENAESLENGLDS